MEKRQATRKPTIQRGEAVLKNGRTLLPCLILDRSETGAHLEFESYLFVPDSFTLRLSTGETIDCEVRNRKEKRVGVSFSSAAA